MKLSVRIKELGVRDLQTNNVPKQLTCRGVCVAAERHMAIRPYKRMVCYFPADPLSVKSQKMGIFASGITPNDRFYVIK
jgi:hypothetical protein